MVKDSFHHHCRFLGENSQCLANFGLAPSQAELRVGENSVLTYLCVPSDPKAVKPACSHFQDVPEEVVTKD